MTPVQETPQIFSLVLVLCVLASFVILLMTVHRLVRGRRASALALLSRWGVAVAVYLAISVVVSVARPVRIIEQGQNWCFDDWCVAVEGVHPQTVSERSGHSHNRRSHLQRRALA